MTSEWAKNRKIDRSDWASGPWDTEVDYVEWTTKAGYPAYAARLDTGAWYSITEAPHPMGFSFSKFCHTLGEMRRDTLSPGSVSKTDQPEIGGFSLSFEHWKSPGPSKRSWFKGEYKTLEEVIEITESLAQDLLLLNNDPSLYAKAFEFPGKDKL